MLATSTCGAQEEAAEHGIFKIKTPTGAQGTAFIVKELPEDVKILATAAHVTAHDKLGDKYVYPGEAYILTTAQDTEVAKASSVVVDSVNDIAIVKAKLPGKYKLLEIATKVAGEPDIDRLPARLPCRVWGFGSGKWTETRGFVSFEYKGEVYNDCVAIPGQSGGPLIVSGKVAGVLSGGSAWYQYGVPPQNLTWPARCGSGTRLKEIVDGIK